MVYVGTSGYSYEDWVGPFYPKGTPSTRFLEHYAQHFPLTEVNYTYYRMPNARTLAAMARKTPPGFLFAVKATSSITHEREATAATYREFREALGPLVEQERLACVLAQFPHSFENTPGNRGYLGKLAEEMTGVPVVVEFRSAEWINEAVEELLRERGLGFCCVDQPRFRKLVPPVVWHTAEPGYVRFHGRNYQKWWRHEEAWERYDYRYSGEELGEWVEKVAELAAQGERTLVLFNNHYAGQAVQNAQMFTELLAEAGVAVARPGEQAGPPGSLI